MIPVKWSRSRWAWAAAAVVALILLVTMWPGSTEKRSSFIPFTLHADAVKCLLRRCDGFLSATRYLIEDVLGNIILFVPVGVTFSGALAARTTRRRFWLCVSLGAGLSIAIEAIQFTISTRATDIDDVLLNVIGTAVGSGLFIRSGHTEDTA